MNVSKRCKYLTGRDSSAHYLLSHRVLELVRELILELVLKLVLKLVPKLVLASVLGKVGVGVTHCGNDAVPSIAGCIPVAGEYSDVSGLLPVNRKRIYKGMVRD